MTAVEFLEKLVKAHDQWARDREESFREIPSYDPVEGDQPCSDEDMNDWDEMDDSFAFHAQEEFINLAAEAREILEMESK